MSDMSDELIDLLFDLSSIGLDTIAPGKFDHINVSDIYPERKDLMRARDMAKLPKGIDAGGPLHAKARSQAKAIQNSEKLIRRAKAVVATWGTGVHDTVKGMSSPWEPFRERMVLEGFRAEQVTAVETYKRN